MHLESRQFSKLEAPTTYRVDARAMYGGDIPSVHMALCAKSPFLLVKMSIYVGSNHHLCWFKSPSILKNKVRWLKNKTPICWSKSLSADLASQ